MTVIKPEMINKLVTRHDLLPLSFIAMTPYTGSKRGVRYRIEKVSDDGRELLRLYNWRTPFSYDCTPAEDISVSDYEFSEAGLSEIVAYLNVILTEER